MDDELFQVASPSLQEVAALGTPAQIAQLPLLSDMSPQGWRDWFRAAQVPGTTLPPIHTVNDSTDAMRTAVYGLG